VFHTFVLPINSELIHNYIELIHNQGIGQRNELDLR
jgi:hypothetical protein